MGETSTGPSPYPVNRFHKPARKPGSYVTKDLSDEVWRRFPLNHRQSALSVFLTYGFQRLQGREIRPPILDLSPDAVALRVQGALGARRWRSLAGSVEALCRAMGEWAYPTGVREDAVFTGAARATGHCVSGGCAIRGYASNADRVTGSDDGNTGFAQESRLDPGRATDDDEGIGTRGFEVRSLCMPHHRLGAAANHGSGGDDVLAPFFQKLGDEMQSLVTGHVTQVCTAAAGKDGDARRSLQGVLQFLG